MWRTGSLRNTLSFQDGSELPLEVKLQPHARMLASANVATDNVAHLCTRILAESRTCLLRLDKRWFLKRNSSMAASRYSWHLAFQSAPGKFASNGTRSCSGEQLLRPYAPPPASINLTRLCRTAPQCRPNTTKIRCSACATAARSDTWHVCNAHCCAPHALSRTSKHPDSTEPNAL